MRFHSLFIIASLCVVPTAQAEMEKIAIPDEQGLHLYWWPKLPDIAGWHQDREQCFRYKVNALAPNNAAFANAETVMYAKAIFKPRDPKMKTVEMLIARDRSIFLKEFPGIEIQETKPLVTADGKKFKSYTFFPKGSGNWERVAYGEFFLIFTVSSRSKAGYNATESTYEKLVALYKENP
jgi:hypothetical protein